MIPAGAPFGGYKQSGIGRETHKVILEHYTQKKNIMINLRDAFRLLSRKVSKTDKPCQVRKGAEGKPSAPFIPFFPWQAGKTRQNHLVFNQKSLAKKGKELCPLIISYPAETSSVRAPWWRPASYMKSLGSKAMIVTDEFLPRTP